MLGPPGSGKGTIAASLKKEFGLPHVSSGHLLRQEIDNDSPLGRQARMFLENGELVPDEIVLKLMAGWLAAPHACDGFMLDGFPRNVRQAVELDGWLSEHGVKIDSVICFDGPEDEIVHRIAGRRNCPRCGRVFQIPALPPRVEGICDDCGEKLTRRDDDTEMVMRKRFEIYRRETEPLVRYYRERGKLTLVDAMRPITERCGIAAEVLIR